MKSQPITNPRIIRGLFTELEQSKSGLIVEDLAVFVHLCVTESSTAQKGYVLVAAEHIACPDICNVSFWVGGEYFKCQLVAVGKSQYAPPEAIDTINRREKFRTDATDISALPILSVLQLSQQKVYSRLESIAPNHISISILLAAKSIPIGDTGTLHSYIEGSLVGAHNVRVEQIRQTDSKHVLLILGVVEKTVNNARTSERGTTINSVIVNLLWPARNGISIPVEIDEFTGLGVSGRFVAPDCDILPPGTVFLESATSARIRLAWRRNNSVGFSFDTSEPSLREELFDSIASRTSTVPRTAERDRSKTTLSILTRAGLLKGDRAVSFADNAKNETFLSRSAVSRRWLCQSTSAGHFLSFARLSDKSWFIQELGSVTDNSGNGANMIVEGVRDLVSSRHEETAPGSRLLGIYDIKSKFNIEFWRTTIRTLCSRAPHYSRVTLGSIKGKKLLERTPSESVWVQRPQPREWVSIYSQIYSEAQRELLAAFGITRDDYQPRLLSDIFLADEKRLDREVYYLTDASGSTLGYLLKLGLPPLTNVTSLLENLFILPISADHRAIIDAVFFHGNPSLVGVEDICLLDSTQEDDAYLKEVVAGFTPREFELIALDLNAIEAAR